MSGAGIAIIGAGMIGAAHASGYRMHAARFPGLAPVLDTVCDMNEAAAGKLAATYGFNRVASDWRAVIDDPEIKIVSVCLPNFLHTEVTRAALAAGKHVLCEKPLATNVEEARETARLAAQAEGRSGTVFNYRRIPALTEIAARLRSGELGEPVQMTIFYQCDYAADPMLPHSWRYEIERAGPGALLDLGTHAVDMMRYLFGDVAEITGALSNISVSCRFLPAEATSGHGHVALSHETAAVENDDVMSALLRFANGAQGFMSCSRVAVGTGNRISVEVFGTKGSARFTNEAPSHYDLAIFDGSRPADFTRKINRPTSPNVTELVAVPHDLVPVGYAESFGFLIAEFLTAIAEGRAFENGSIEDGWRAAEVLDAIHRASVSGQPVVVAG